MAYQKIDPSQAEAYPPNIQAILKRATGPGDYMGLEPLELDKDAGRIRVAFHVENRMCNKWGGVHGGMVAAMMDEVMALAVGLSLEWGEITPTLEMKTSFIAAAKPGTHFAEGWTVKRGRSVAFMEASLHDADGNLIATASSTARIVQTKRDNK